ncbi:glycosyltransferase family 2 protein [Phaeacidiphilus oryzae]|jgi:glycosyltransferase involved in cell wall biosynthesis|uniref:glycosyltransferase family 2 protein n=1 Tax=Phaeacidiphilus oryzae TaxID=348818 RepID=UPI0009FF7267|nr:glycosyltransferase family 2 protein [Phaeacidiphilus oryzae]
MNVPETDRLLRAPESAGGGVATAVLAEPPLPEREPRPVVGTGTVTVIVPARNEAANVGWVLSRMPDCVDEVILVDGDSTDATLEMARASLPGVRVVAQHGQGKGSALRTGFTEAKGDYIVMIDADGSMSPREIPRYVHFLENGYDFVKGSRFMGGGGSLDITTVRRLGNRALLALTNVMYQSTLTDLCYGFIAFRRDALDRLDLQSTGFEIETEMVVRALLGGLRVAEVPTLELPRRTGQSNLRTFRDGQRVLRTLLREHRGRTVPAEAAG